MSIEDIGIYPNARSPLLGEPEDSIGIIDTAAVAGLGGDFSPVIDVENEGEGVIPIGSSALDFLGVRALEQFNPQIIATTTVTPPVSTPINRSIVTIVGMAIGRKFVGGGNSNITITLVKDGSTTLATKVTSVDSTGTQGDMMIVSAVEINQTAVLHTYELRVTQVGDDVTISNGGIKATVLDPNDTHAGSIITQATATKQINSADSHRTHEQAVLPA